MNPLAFLRRRPLVGVGILAVFVVAGALAAPLFLPKPSTQANEAAPMAAASGSSTATKQGSFVDGAPGHHAEGMAKLLRTQQGWVLRLENYDATAGPDVYFYLSPVAQPARTQDVESGLRLVVPGGDEDGEATVRGNFNVPLPAGFDPAAYQSLAAWCDRFDVLFGYATLA